MVAPKKKLDRVDDLLCEVCGTRLGDHPDGRSPHGDDHWFRLSEEDSDRLSPSAINALVRRNTRIREGDYSVQLPPPEERRRIREAAGWTQEDLGDELDVSRYVIYRFEKLSGYRIGGERLQGREPSGGIRERYAALLRRLEREGSGH